VPSVSVYDTTKLLLPSHVKSFDNRLYLSYTVLTNGMTLRDFVKLQYINNRRTILSLVTKRYSIDILLQLIDACEYMLKNNLMVSQSCLNPDLIWIDNYSNTLRARIIYTQGVNVRDDIMYWSPELLSKYKYVNYYDVKKQTCLKRYDTRPSTLSSVYSLGLILYFIEAKENPFENCARVDVYQRPYTSELNTTVANIILMTTDDIKERPTITELRDYIHKLPFRSYFNLLCWW
jgi:hypothetical protein